MNKYEVGFEDDFFGCFFGRNYKEAIAQCKADLKEAGLWSGEYARKSMRNEWIVNGVEYVE